MAQINGEYVSVGRRKESTARIRLRPGTGRVEINGKPVDKYLQREVLVMMTRQPFEITDSTGKWDVRARVEGGGLSGQAGALRLGIARALAEAKPDLKATLRGAGLLTRDARTVERKKYGQPGARKRFQFSKR